MSKQLFEAIHHLSHRLHTFIHHFVVALTVASVVGLLHHSGGLAWLDGVMLRIAGSHNAESPQAQVADTKSPEVLLIGGALYEQVFDQRSPLDRSKLAQLVSAIYKKSQVSTETPVLDEDQSSRGVGAKGENPATPPATAVFDLDLSPMGGDKEGQAELDEALKALAENGAWVVLPLPTVAYTPEAVRAKVDWMRRACGWRSTEPGLDGRVVFASPMLRSTGGRVLQYSTSDLSLGIAAKRPKAFDDVCERTDAELQLLVQMATGELTRNLRAEAPAFPKMRPFNAQFFQGLPQHVHELTSVEALPSLANGEALSLGRRVVFIGGGYDLRDRFDTAFEPDGQATEGVNLHAAVYYSAMNPVTVEEGVWAWALDVVLGVLMGYFFTATWSWHASIVGGRGWRPYLLPKLGLVAILLGAFLLMVLLVWVASAVLLPLNLWVSPGPVVIGVCAKLMLSRGSHGHDNGQEEDLAPHPSRWLHRALIAALPLANIGVILSHSH